MNDDVTDLHSNLSSLYETQSTMLQSLYETTISHNETLSSSFDKEDNFIDVSSQNWLQQISAMQKDINEFFSSLESETSHLSQDIQSFNFLVDTFLFNLRLV